MSEIIFDDKSIKPALAELKAALGNSWNLWSDFRHHIEEQYGPLTEDWKFYMQKSGWTLKVLKKKRNLFFFSPRKNHFLISFIFGDKAVAVVQESSLPSGLIEELVNSRKYMEGRGILIKIESPDQLAHLKELVQIKVDN